MNKNKVMKRIIFLLLVLFIPNPDLPNLLERTLRLTTLSIKLPKQNLMLTPKNSKLQL